MSSPRSVNRLQMLLMPPCLDDWVGAEHPVRFVWALVESISIQELGFRVPDPRAAGAPGYDPQMLLAVWLYGWMDRKRSSRQLEAACLRDVTYMWLTAGQHPDHNTLWRFFADNKKQLKELFKKTIQVAVRADLIGFALHAVDGTKIPTASSMETALHRKALNDKLKKLDEVINAQVAQAEQTEQQEDASWAMPERLKDAKELRAEVQQALKQLDEAEADHLHPDEPEAKVMLLRGGHNTLAYNGQAVVDQDSGMIVAEKVVTDGSDNAQLVPMIDEVNNNAGRSAAQNVADGGYCSGEQLDTAEKRRLRVLVNVQQEAETKGDFAKSNFRYDAQCNGYVCPLGEFLPFQKRQRSTSRSAEMLDVYRCHNKRCPMRGKCTSDKHGRTIKRSPYEPALQRHRELVAKPDNKLLLRARKAIVEHVFGVIKSNHGFRRFTAKGLDSADGQWALACTAFNMWKLFRVWIQGDLVLTAA